MNNPPPQFRQANPDDFYQLASLRWDFQREEEDHPPVVNRETFLSTCVDFFQRGFDRGNWVHWVAEVDGSIVAHASIQLISMVPRPERPEDAFGYLTNVYTKPGFRNQGTGSRLLETVRHWSETSGLELLIVWPSEKSEGFYKRQGFVSSEEILELGFRS